VSPCKDASDHVERERRHLGAWVIPEGALVVKAALLEEEHDFGAVVVLST
jgi:hypothetical protein